MQPFNGPLGFCPVLPGELAPERESQAVKTNLDLLEQETLSGSGISWAIRKSASYQHFTTQVFYRLDALPATQPINNNVCVCSGVLLS